MRHFHCLVTLCAFAAFALGGSSISASAQNTFFTTGTYTIDATHSVAETAYVGLDSGFSRTDSIGNPYNPTVNLVPGGTVGNLFGGNLKAYNSSQVNVSGGNIGGAVGGYLQALDTSHVNVSGGTISLSLQAFDSSQVNVSGGVIGSGYLPYNSNNSLQTSGGSQVTISGGTFTGALVSDGSSQVIVSGGTFGTGLGGNFFDGTTGSFTLIGYNLLATNPRPDNYIGNGTDYDLSGTLLGGTNLSGYGIEVLSISTLTLQNVPEPGNIVMLVGMGVTGAAFLRRHKQAQKIASPGESR